MKGLDVGDSCDPHAAMGGDSIEMFDPFTSLGGVWMPVSRAPSPAAGHGDDAGGHVRLTASGRSVGGGIYPSFVAYGPKAQLLRALGA